MEQGTIEIILFGFGEMVVFFVFLARLSARVSVLESKCKGLEGWVEKVEERQWNKQVE